MAQTITVPTKTFEEILSRLDQLTKEIRVIKAKLFDNKPLYGSDEWWEWSDRQAMEDVKAGRFVELKNKEELKVYLDSLKSA